MRFDWLAAAGIVCGIGILVSVFGQRYRPHPAWRALIAAFAIALAAGSVASLIRTSHRDDKFAHIRIEQDDVHKRLDVLQAEIASSKGPVDPAVAKDRRDRLEALQRDLDAIRKESDELKGSGAGK